MARKAGGRWQVSRTPAGGKVQVRETLKPRQPRSAHSITFKSDATAAAWGDGHGDVCVGGVRRWCVAVGVADVEQLLISVAHTKLLIQLFTLFLAADNKKPRTHLRVLFRENCCYCCCFLFLPQREAGKWLCGRWLLQGLGLVST